MEEEAPARGTWKKATAALGSAARLSNTTTLPEIDIRRLLAAVAEDVYDFNGEHFAGRLVCEESVQDTNGKAPFQYGIYLIKGGSFDGQKICAYRGKFDTMGIDEEKKETPEMNPVIRATLTEAVRVAKSNQVNWVTGHSLGGLIAEAVCASSGIGGSSFDTPGPWYKTDVERNVIDGNRYNGIPFEYFQGEGDVKDSAEPARRTSMGKATLIFRNQVAGMAQIRSILGNL